MGLPFITEEKALSITKRELLKEKNASILGYYNPNQNYKKDDIVAYNGEIYKSLLDSNFKHDPATEKNYWIRLEHVLDYTAVLPQADEKSVSFVEVNGQLYYKTNSSNANGYQYKPITSGGSGSGIQNVIVDGKSVVSGDIANILLPIKEYALTYLYKQNDLAVYGGHIFRSLKNDNINNVPPTATDYWQDISKNMSHAESELPEANINSPMLVEFAGDLYYKVEVRGSKYVSYSYEKANTDIPEIPPSLEYYNIDKTYEMNDFVFYLGKVYKSIARNNKGNAPTDNKESNFWKLLSFSFEKILRSEAKTYDFKYNTLYEIVEDDTKNITFAIYDNGELIEINSKAEPGVKSVSIAISEKAQFPTREGHTIELLCPLAKDIEMLADAYLNGDQVFVIDEATKARFDVIYAYSNGTNHREFSIIYKDHIVTYTKDDHVVNADILDLHKQYINITAKNGTLECSSFTDMTIIRYLDSKSSCLHYLTKEMETDDTLIYASSEYVFAINKYTFRYDIAENTLGSLKLEVNAEGLDGSEYIKYPKLTHQQITAIHDMFLIGKSVVVFSNETIHSVQSIKEISPGIFMLVLSAYNSWVKQTVLITYEASTSEVEVTMRPLQPITLYFHENGESSGTLPATYGDLIKHSDNAFDVSFRYIQGYGTTKTSNLTFEYHQDHFAYYTNKDFWCELDLETLAYTIGSFNS